VKDVTDAFMADMDGDELRLTTVATAEEQFDGNGREGYKFNIASGYLEKGLPELSYEGFKSDHEGIAAWNSDGTGPEPARTGHCYTWNGDEYCYPYYGASRDYDDMDPDPEACMAHFTDSVKGFPNLLIQLAYRGYTIDQLKVKIDTLTLGNDIEGEDWGIDAAKNIHWYNYYGGYVTIEIAGEPILAITNDTSFNHDTLGVGTGWSQYTNYTNYLDVSSGASSNAKYLLKSLLKDLSGHNISFTHDGCPAYEIIDSEGRNGSFHNIWGSFTGKQPAGTHIWGPEVSGTWTQAGSPYIVMDYIIVPDGETLQIDPGVVVKFNSTERFDVQGCLLAEGDVADQILFTAVDDDTPWGGIFFDQTPATNDPSKFIHCVFEYAYGYDETYGYNCGGALDINLVDTMIISHCTFRYNSADNETGNTPTGGALAIFGSSFTVNHCIFHDNSSLYGGAMMIGQNSNPVIDNCLFYNNECTKDGGAVIVWHHSDPHFINCTFTDNYADRTGGVFELETGSDVSVTNCIFWGNWAGSDFDQINIYPEHPTSSINIYYCDVEEGIAGITPGFFGDTVNIYDLDPEFEILGDNPYVQSVFSPCNDVGTLNPLYLPVNYNCPTNCLCGHPRVTCDGIDLGCYERFCVGVDDIDDSQNSSVSIFPNPVQSQTTIVFTLQNAASAQLSVVDITGRLVYESEATGMQNGRNQITFRAEDLPSGLYLCKLRIGNEVITKKIIKY
jgi:hypothetical protein